MNLSKLVDDDEPLFKNLLGDVFPDVKIDESADEDIRQAIISNAKA